MHDPRLLDALSNFRLTKLDAEVYRATRQNLDPLTPSTAGGRWSPRGAVPVLYTSMSREGALAEISFHWSQLEPVPTKPVALHRLKVGTSKTLRIVEADFPKLGIAPDHWQEVSYIRTQEVGAAISFLGIDGLLVPCARWHGENLVLFTENSELESDLQLLETEHVDWRKWALANGFLV